MKKLFSIILAMSFAVASVFVPATALAGDNCTDSPVQHCGIHDPSLMKANDGRYYIVGSHLGMGESDDLINFNNNGFSIDGENYFDDWKTELAEPLAWCLSYQKVTNERYEPGRYDNPEYNCWANDIIYNEAMGKYCLYGCCSVWGTTASVIWLATSENVKGPYKYVKSFIYSGITPKPPLNKFYNGLYYKDTNIPEDIVQAGYIKENLIPIQPWFYHNLNNNDYVYACGWNEYPNCIDPTAFFDADGELWMVYGSYSGGCFVIKLDNETGTPDYAFMNSKRSEGYDIYYGKKVSATNAGTEGTGEGPFIIYDEQSEYYYFFLTYGGLDKNGGYNIREYRSENPDGPYLDAAGNKATDLKNTGLKLIGNYKFDCNKTANLSPGHSSCFIDDDGSMYQAFHVRFLSNWDFQTRIHKMARTSDGWSVILPFEYQGEKDTVLTADDVIGSYEYIDSTNITHRKSETNTDNDMVLPTQIITLNANGTITGARDYSSNIDHTNLGYRNVSGTWSLETDGVNASFKIGNVEYTGVFTVQKDESAETNETIVFSAKGDDNSTIWGARHNLTVAARTLATCTADGYTTYSCSHCSKTMRVMSAPRLGHHPASANNAVAATCARNGKRADTICSRCKIVLARGAAIRATGKHTYDTGRVTKAPTSSVNGVMTYTCKVCKGKKTSAISKLTNSSFTKLTAQKKGFKLQWKKVANATGYQIRYSTSSKMSKPKVITISKNSTVTRTVSKLSAKKKYYVQIRTYRTIQGNKYYSTWSKAKTVTTKK